MTALEGQFKKVKDCDLDDFKSIKLDTLDALHDIYKSINRRKKCEVCGTSDENKIYDWACVGDYKNPNDYKRMCRSCHWKHDKIGNNFPNHPEPPSSQVKQFLINNI